MNKSINIETAAHNIALLAVKEFTENHNFFPNNEDFDFQSLKQICKMYDLVYHSAVETFDDIPKAE